MSRVHFSHAGAPRGLRVLHQSLVLILFSLVPGASAWFMGGGISYVTLPSLGIPPVYVFPSLYITHKKKYPCWQHSTSFSPGQWVLPIVAHTNTSRGTDKSASDIGRQDGVQETVNWYYFTWNGSLFCALLDLALRPQARGLISFPKTRPRLCVCSILLLQMIPGTISAP